MAIILVNATLAFIVGNIAASTDQETVVLLTIDGVWLATRGHAEGVHREGFQPLVEVMRAFISNGGQVWACGTCAKPRGITEADLVEGAKVVSAANVVEYMARGASTLSF